MSADVEASSVVVRRTLTEYAKRGVFRAYGDRADERGRNWFSFRWHTDATLHVVYDSRRRELIFSDLLPAIGSRSEMYRELKRFIRARTPRTVAEHRRIDPRKATIAIRNRKGMVSLVVALKDGHLVYGVRKAINLIHEIFVEFLRYPAYFNYMVEQFNVDPDV